MSDSSWSTGVEGRHERLVRLFGHQQPVAWITGSAANRVGRQIAKHLFAHGYRIVLHARSSVAEGEMGVEQLNRLRTDSAMLVVGDVAEPDFSKQAVDKIDKTFGRLDVLVNSAAIWDPVPLDLVTREELHRNYDANVVGTFLCAQQASMLMRSQKEGGAIINVGDWAIERPYSGFSAYFPSKAAIPGLTRCLAVELAAIHHAIRVNAILPGPVKVPDEMSAEARTKLLQQCLLQREGSSQDIAEGVLYLAEAPFVTGISLPVDGGRFLFGAPSTDSTAHPSHVQ
jgi:pteridine reductase